MFYCIEDSRYSSNSLSSFSFFLFRKHTTATVTDAIVAIEVKMPMIIPSPQLLLLSLLKVKHPYQKIYTYIIYTIK